MIILVLSFVSTFLPLLFHSVVFFVLEAKLWTEACATGVLLARNGLWVVIANDDTKLLLLI